MRKLILAALAASAFVAAPAAAQETTGLFSGARLGATIGTGGDDPFDFDGTTVGLDLGYDWDTGGAVIGIGAEYETDLGDDFLDVNQTALYLRAGGKVSPNALLYASAGLARISDGASPFDDGEEGVRVGAGLELGVGSGGSSLRVEQRYVDYGGGANAWQTVAGFNIRF